jgi:hypothetical protein
MQAIGATLLISAAPFFILFFIPLDNSQEKQWLLKEGSLILLMPKIKTPKASTGTKCCGSESERIRNFLPEPNPNPKKNSDSDSDNIPVI